MSIIDEIALSVRKFVAENYGRKPDRLIINYYKLNEVRINTHSLRLYGSGPTFDAFMGMKIITTDVDIEGGFEVR